MVHCTVATWTVILGSGARPSRKGLAEQEVAFSSRSDETRSTTSGRSGSWSIVAAWLRPFADSVATLFFPANCRICCEPLLRVSRLPVCTSCRDGILPIQGNVCSICGERTFSFYSVASNENESEPCGLCRLAQPPFTQAVAYGAFEDSLRAAIRLLKYDRVLPAAGFLGQRLSAAMSKMSILGETETADAWLVIPVPLHAGKLRQRGFNQAELIARAALRETAWLHLRMETKALVRSRETISQAGLTRHQRRQNIRGAFRVRKPAFVASKDILLVDDVMTTGATVAECARVLLRAGARSVRVVTVARTLKADRALNPMLMTEAA
jgi:ComF family protein